jgi:aldehyde dehydrogenase (NAD+)/retinal dehydrogenase
MSSTGYTIPLASDITNLYINGEYIEPKAGKTYTLYNPTDDSVVSDRIPIAEETDVDAAVDAAEIAFNGPWGQFTGAQRSACLRKLADLLEEDDRLIKLLTLDAQSTGNPVSIIPTREKTYILGHLLYYGAHEINSDNSGIRS